MKISSSAQVRDQLGLSVFRFCAYLVIALIMYLIWHLVDKGYESISWNFVFQQPTDGMTKGGVFPAVIGTLYVTLITGIFALPLGVGAAIYLTEYARDSIITRLIRLSIRNLSGVPSIVYGLFGMAMFVKTAGIKPGILTGGLTLALLILPWTITTAEEALKQVPKGFREAAMALGATPWFTIRTAVLPSALPGILTGLILGLARAAGETAPLLFVGVSFFLPQLPGSPLDQFMALPYHLYVLATQHQNIELVRPLAYGTALLLVILIMTLSGGVIIWRARLRKKYQQW